MRLLLAVCMPGAYSMTYGSVCIKCGPVQNPWQLSEKQRQVDATVAAQVLV